MLKNCSTCRSWEVITAEGAKEWDYLGNWAIGAWGWCQSAIFEQAPTMCTRYLEGIELTQSAVYCPNWAPVGNQQEQQCTSVS